MAHGGALPGPSGGLRGPRPRSTLSIREPIAVLQHNHADHEAQRLRRAALRGRTPRQRIVYPGPVDFLRRDDEFVLHELQGSDRSNQGVLQILRRHIGKNPSNFNDVIDFHGGLNNQS